MRTTNWMAIVLFGATTLGAAAACSSSDGGSDGATSTATADGGSTPPSSAASDGSAPVGCRASTKECVNDKLARICPADGSGWIAQTCASDEKCNNGACEKDPSAVEGCTSGMDACVGNTAMRCKADGKGFDAVACPANTTCVAGGKCQGACIVGASACSSNSIVQSCVDGLQMTWTACPAGQYCVDQGNGTAACKAGDCDPDACTVCGNKVNAGADQTKFTSSCMPTPNGYKWVASQCFGALTCDPGAGGSCAAGGPSGLHASCAAECFPGESRCRTFDEIQTCDATGHWSSAVTACNANPAATNLRCMASPSKPNTAICGDPVCAMGMKGACQADGKIKLCGADGKLAATATACASGICQAFGTFNGVAAGSCIAECTDGDARCVVDGGTSYQTCENGVWSAPSNCAAGTCYSYTSSVTNRPAKLCDAVCSPGAHRCTDANGDPGNDHIETCSATGQWGPAAACTVGVCQPSGNDAACVAQCVPGSKVCLNGGTEEGTCTAAGLYPASGDACSGTKTCRTANGIALGCVECIGPNHGQTPESRCVDANNGNAVVTTGGTGTQICQNDDTWPAAGVDCPASTTCSTQDTVTSCMANGFCGQNCVAGPCPPFGMCCTPIFGSEQCGAVSDCCPGMCMSGVQNHAAACK